MKGTPAPRFDRQFLFRQTAVYGRSAKTKPMIFFDVDDTLINQRKAERQALGQLLALYGDWLQPSPSLSDLCCEWRELRDKHNVAFFAGEISLHEQRRRRVRELFARRQKRIARCEADLFFACYEYYYRKNWSLFDDVLPFFRSVRGFGCGIITNGSTAQQRLKLQRTGIVHHFDVVVVAEEIGVAKPERDIFLAACEQARCPAASCFYVGDSLERDALASAAAGLRPFWLDRECARTDTRVDTIGSLYELRCRLESEIAK
jgi:putative hydrolase of the HAD superfamily